MISSLKQSREHSDRPVRLKNHRAIARVSCFVPSYLTSAPSRAIAVTVLTASDQSPATPQCKGSLSR
ncbi:MAG: hypothetical protein AAFX78_19085 [Cyanobacteria bacterium J06638_20]